VGNVGLKCRPALPQWKNRKGCSQPIDLDAARHFASSAQTPAHVPSALVTLPRALTVRPTDMRVLRLFTLAPAFFCLALWSALPLARAADPAPLTAREIAQGFRDRTLLALPRANLRATTDAAESRERLRVRARFSHLRDLRVLEFPDDDPDALGATLARLQATGRYEFVERDYLRRLAVTPNDTSFPTQWALSNTGQSGGFPNADIKALAAWDVIREAPNVVVAVLDTGVNLTHQDLAPNLWRNPAPSAANDLYGANFVGGLGALVNGNPADDGGHGSHVAGIIGAVGNNATGVSGVAWQVQIMAVKVFPGTGFGTTSEIAAGINYAIARGAHIINASYGDTGASTFTQTELNAVTAARDAGVLFVAAAGNAGSNMDVARHYPASFALDNIVTVGSTTRNETVATSSNFGAAVDLLAPGEAILSLGSTSPTATATLSGTSMAAPHVAGALALLKARFPTDTYRQLINRLLRGAEVIPRYAGKSQAGSRLDLFGAVTSTSNRPFNDDFAQRARLAGDNFLVRSHNTGATAEPGEPVPSGDPVTTSLWWEWTPTATAVVRLTTTGSAYDTRLAVYTGTVLAALTLVATNDNDGASITSRIDFTAQAGVTYQVAVDGRNATSGLTLLNVGSIPVNDAFASPATLAGQSDGVTATNANCAREAGEPRILSFTGGTSLWYRWTAPQSGRFQFAAFSSDFDPLLAVYTGTALNALTLISASDNSGTGNSQTSSLCAFDAVAGTTYLVTVDSKSAAGVGQFTLTVCDALWQADTGTAATPGSALTGAPAVAADGTIYQGSTDRAIYAFTPEGTLKWRVATGGLIDTCSPAVADDGTIYIGSNDGLLRALRPDGTLLWSHSFNSPTTTYPVSNSPALALDGTIYVKANDGYLYALEPTDGSTRWRTNVNSVNSYASPVVAPDGTIYQGTDNAVASERKLYALNPGDGSVKWTYTVDNDIYTTPALDTAGNLYFGVLSSGWLYSLTSAGTLRWIYRGATQSTTSSPVLSADGATVYFAAYDKKLHAVATANGAPRWTHTLGDEVRASSPAVDADGVIYIGSYDYKLYAINPDGTRRRTWSTGNWIRSSPALVGNRLYVGSNDHKLYAFDLGASTAGTGPWPQYRHNARRLGRAATDTSTPARLANFSVRATAGTGNAALIAGFALAGDSQSILVRGIGPGLTAFGVTGAVTDPRLELYAASATTALAANDDWGGGTLAATYARLGAFALDPASRDAALLTLLAAGTYTAVVSSSSTAGLALVELYAADPTLTTARLTNLSARSPVGTGGNLLIAGFVLTGTAPKMLLIRGIGPALAAFNVTGALADPRLDLYRGNTLVYSNDNWSTATGGSTVSSATFTAVGAFALPDSTSRDSALLVNLAPGAYTAQISGVNNTTGVALVEVYEVP